MGAMTSMRYAVEEFSPEEAQFLSQYVTNLDRPVFALINMPEVVKSALFARYSRSPKSLRRLILDEFADDLRSATSSQPGQNTQHANELFNRVFAEYGDDSVAQLGGAHLACEQASNILTKIIEWHRTGNYLEQSTRYISYADQMGGRYKYLDDPTIASTEFAQEYTACMDYTFEQYSALLDQMIAALAAANPIKPGETPSAYQRTIKAQALDAVRGLLPASSLSNLGIYASGQTYEHMIMRMRALPLQEAVDYSQMMLEELRKVIPDFLQRVDRPDRGNLWSEYLSDTSAKTQALCDVIMGGAKPDTERYVQMTQHDPDGEDSVLAAICAPYVRLPESEVREKIKGMSDEQKDTLFETYVGTRENRRHKPGRALEATSYRFDILADYGSFRDLQRHRMLTIEWQPLSCLHGYDVPQLIVDYGYEEQYRAVMDRQAALYHRMHQQLPNEAAYVVGLGYKVRYSMQLNAREAMHLCELRSQPQGHISYRRIAQEIHRQIREVAGHRRIADAMNFVDYSGGILGRREAEIKSERKREANGAPRA